MASRVPALALRDARKALLLSELEARTASNRLRTAFFEIARNECDAAPRSFRPCGKFDRRMREVLQELHHDRPAATLDVRAGPSRARGRAAQRDQRRP